MTVRGDILREATSLTEGDRNKDYGDPYDTFLRIAEIFKAISGHELSAKDVAYFNLAQKIARTEESPQKLDNYIDGAAYLAIAGEINARA